MSVGLVALTHPSPRRPSKPLPRERGQAGAPTVKGAINQNGGRIIHLPDLMTSENANQNGEKSDPKHLSGRSSRSRCSKRTELYKRGNAITGWVHFSGLALADGRIFSVNHDSSVYCFGLKDK